MGDKKVKWYDRQQVDVQDMNTEQSYHIEKQKDAFYNIFNDGIASGLLISEDSSMVSQTVGASNDTTLSNTSNKIYQVFQATSDNIQEIIVRAKRVAGTTGLMRATILNLTTPTDPISNIGTTISDSSINIATVISDSALAEISFDFSSTTVADAGALTVGNYYIIEFFTPTLTGGPITLSYSTTSQYAGGSLRRNVGSEVIYQNEDLYFKINTAAVQFTLGVAFKNGQAINAITAQRKVNFTNTTIGQINYFSIKFLATETDSEIAPRLGTAVNSRIEDSFEFVVSTTLPAYNNSTSILLGSATFNGSFPFTVADLRTFLPNHTIVNYEEIWKIFGKLQIQDLKSVVASGENSDAETVSQELAFISRDTVTNSAPTVTDDASKGYNKFSRWIDTSDFNRLYFCKDPTTGAAEWEEAGGGGAIRGITISSATYDLSSVVFNTVNANTTSNDITVSLPTALNRANQVLTFKNIGTSTLIISPDGTDEIEGINADYYITVQNVTTRIASIKDESTSTYHWWII